MADGKRKIQIYADWWDSFKEMDDETAGKLIKLILGYVNDEHPERNLPKGDLLRILFIPYQNQLDVALEAWKTKCEKNKKNIEAYWNEKKGIQTNTNVYERIPKDTDKIREDKIREDNITTLRSVIHTCVCENGLTEEDYFNIIQYVEDNKITEIKYPDAFVKNYKERKLKAEKDDNPQWLKDYIAHIEDNVQYL